MVSIIIAHFKGSNNLEKCLKSVMAQTCNSKEVIVIDNSESKSVESRFIEKFPMVKFINPERNLFYSAAQNLGIKESRGSYILFLNDDAILKEEFISQLIQGMKNSKDIGMVCGKILRLDGVTIDTAGQFLGKERKPIERGWQKKDHGQYDCFSYIFSPGGVAPLYRREVLEEVALDGEYFDKDFKIFYEDLDLAWRANKFGWRVFYTPLAVAYHQRGATTQSEKSKSGFLKKYYFANLPDNLQFHLVKNRYSTIIKNDSVKSFLFNLPDILVYEIKLWSYILLFRTKLVLDLIKNRNFFLKAWKKRKLIKRMLKEKSYEEIPH